jgi:hypothetical protein
MAAEARSTLLVLLALPREGSVHTGVRDFLCHLSGNLLGERMVPMMTDESFGGRSARLACDAFGYGADRSFAEQCTQKER